MSTPKLYRPTLQKQPKTAKGYVAAMTDKPHPSDSDWSGSEYREWVKWADYASAIAAKDAEIAGLREANRYLVRISNEAIQDASNYCEAQKGIARLREALSAILYWHEYVGHVDESWFDAARAALATVEGVGK